MVHYILQPSDYYFLLRFFICTRYDGNTSTLIKRFSFFFQTSLSVFTDRETFQDNLWIYMYCISYCYIVYVKYLYTSNTCYFRVTWGQLSQGAYVDLLLIQYLIDVLYDTNSHFWYIHKTEFYTCRIYETFYLALFHVFIFIRFSSQVPMGIKYFRKISSMDIIILILILKLR